MRKIYPAFIIILVSLLTACTSPSVVNTTTTDNLNRSANNENTVGVKEKDSPATEKTPGGNLNSADFPDPTKTIVSALALSKQFANEEEAENKYLGKRLKVEGLIKEIVKIERGTSVSIDGQKDLARVLCVFEKTDPKYKNVVSSLKEKEQVKFSGELAEIFGTSTILLENCELIR